MNLFKPKQALAPAIAIVLLLGAAHTVFNISRNSERAQPVAQQEALRGCSPEWPKEECARFTRAQTLAFSPATKERVSECVRRQLTDLAGCRYIGLEADEAALEAIENTFSHGLRLGVNAPPLGLADQVLAPPTW